MPRRPRLQAPGLPVHIIQRGNNSQPFSFYLRGRSGFCRTSGQAGQVLSLRATTNLALLWRRQGSAERPLKLLAPVYYWFTEGFDAKDLKEAKALLEEL